MSGEAAKSFYEGFLAELRKQHSPDKIKDGVFGEYMQVLLTMDFRAKPLKLTITKICFAVEAD